MESVQISFSFDKNIEQAKNSIDDFHAAEICVEIQETERKIKNIEHPNIIQPN